MIRNDASDRQLRSRGARRTITDDVPELNEYIEGLSSKRAFNVETKITSGRFPERFVRYMTGNDFTLDYVRRNGFFSPLVFRNKEGLDMRMPNKQFSVDDVKCYVGNRRIIDVMDVSSQQALEMAMEEFAAYYRSRKRSRLLNVISLEFSQTPMDQLVQSPRVVRLIDWVDKVWPHDLKLEQTEGTNQMMNMKYPKVQKYCLMSVGGSYTDFHIDFGGTSVWYHVLRGEKIFWLIPPTPENLIIYEKWVKSGRQQDVFLGDLVNECGLVRLREGYTFMIPTGWIHAVYTPMDSLVFGGNFLHSFNIEGQLVVSDIEDRTKVPFKFRYPFFVEIMWYVIKDYVTSLERKADNSAAALLNCLSLYEIQGLAALLFRMERTPLWRKRVPMEISDPEALLIQLKSLLNGYQVLTTYMASELREEKPRSVRDDSPPPPSLSPSQRFSDHCYWRFSEAKRTKASTSTEDDRHQNDDDGGGESTARVHVVATTATNLPRDGDDAEYVPKSRAPSGGHRRKRGSASSHSLREVRQRRNRCGHCVGCLSVECRECRYCLDMPKNGGSGRLRQACEKRKCLNMNCQATEETEDSCDSEDDDEEASYDDNDTSSDDLSDVSISSSSSHSMPAIGRQEKAKVQKTGRTARSAKSRSAGPDALSELDMFDFNEEALDLMVGSVQGLAALTPDDLVSLCGGTTTEPTAMNASRERNKDWASPPQASTLIKDNRHRTRSTTAAQRIKKEKSAFDKRRFKKGRDGLGRRDSRNASRGRNPVIRQLEEAQKMKTSFKIPKRANPNSTAQTTSNHSQETIQATPTDHLTYTPPNPTWERNSSPPRQPRAPRARNTPTATTLEPLSRDGQCLVAVFAYLAQSDLSRCMRVSRDWRDWSSRPTFWRTIDLSRKETITANTLACLKRRRVEIIDLSWSGVTQRQLRWICNKVASLKELRLTGCPKSILAAFFHCEPFPPALTSLDLGWIDGLDDRSIRDLFDSDGSAIKNASSLVDLRLTGSAITDQSLALLAAASPIRFTRLDLSYCSFISDRGIDTLLSTNSGLCRAVATVNLSGCGRLTDKSVGYFRRCPRLERLDVRSCVDVSASACAQLVASTHVARLVVVEEKLVESRRRTTRE